MTVVVPALLAMAVFFVMPARQSTGTTGRGPRRVAGAADRGALLQLRPVLAPLAVVAGWMVVGGVPGIVAGALAGVASWRVLGRTEGPAARTRRLELERDFPVAVHLLGACLRAGAAPSVAIRTVAGALPGAVAEEFAAAAARLDLGADPAEVWNDVASEGPLAPLGRALGRAYRTGAPVTDAIDRLSDDLRDAVASRAAARARTVEVRTAAPLGVCFLPAFLLLGVVPMTVGLFASMQLFA